nr:NHL repeat-containing protein [Atribacterota bacterium]
MPNSYKNSNHRLFLLFIWLLFFVGNQVIYAYNAAEYAVEGTFGEFGERAGQFNYPVGIALDKNGNIFISDWENDRIQVFDSTEKYIFTIPDEASNVKLDGPVGIVLDNEDNILVVEQHNHRIHKISPDGHSIMVFGQSGNKPGEFDNPRGIALDKDGNIYVVDTGNSRVQVFSPNFELLFTFGREGMGDGEFYYPRGIAL